MSRYFNTTGLCFPEQHYMVDPFRNLYDDVRRLIGNGQYFVIHAPRQTGKTTLLHQLAHRLNNEGDYVSVVCSLESAGYPGITVEGANMSFISSLHLTASIFLPDELMPPDPSKYTPGPNLFRLYL
ncbi:MAG: ATP-binding protein, partial [Bacteroidota bacterium]